MVRPANSIENSLKPWSNFLQIKNIFRSLRIFRYFQGATGPCTFPMNWNIWNSSRIPTCLCQLPQIPYPRKMRRNHETCSLKQCFHYWALIFCVSILCAFILCVFSVFTLKFRHHQRERKKSRNILWQLFWFMMSHRWLNSSITEHRHLIQ